MTALVYVVRVVNADGTVDVEILDAPPAPAFTLGLIEAGVSWEVREGYVNGGDSAVIGAGAAGTAVLGALADVLLELESPGEAGAILEALAPALPAPMFTELAGMLEVCPVHLCDEAICRDDEAACPAGRGA